MERVEALDIILDLIVFDFSGESIPYEVWNKRIEAQEIVVQMWLELGGKPKERNQ